MLTLLSPSKTQDFASNFPTVVKDTHTQPLLLESSAILVDILRKKSIDDISRLMQVSETIATCNYNRFQDFSIPFSAKNARPALLAFKGDVYTDMDTDNYTKADFDFAQQHFCILSGLYGLLRPLDLIQPYRLEMKTKLTNPAGKSLYNFWNSQLTDTLNQLLALQDRKVVINLASNEYCKALQPKNIQAGIITPVFKEQKGDTYRVVAIYIKRARGMMANHIIRHRIDQPEALKAFAEGGYSYSNQHSNGNEWVYIR